VNTAVHGARLVIGHTLSSTEFHYRGAQRSTKAEFRYASDTRRNERDATTFHCRYTRELLRDGSALRTRSGRQDIARDLQ
jgi:hypothetical protein